MKLLLDTHIWLWSLHDLKLLGKRIQNELRDPANELWLSPISTWEALTLNAKGRIRLRGNLAEWVALATAPFHEAPLTHEIALVARQLPLPPSRARGSISGRDGSGAGFDAGHCGCWVAGVGGDCDVGESVSRVRSPTSETPHR